MYEPLVLAPIGSVGNNTHNAAKIGGAWEAVACQFVVEAVGATPTVTFKFQGSLDGTNWFDLGYITDATDTVSASTRVVTAVGASVAFISNPVARRYNFFRLITTANTNVTYRGELYLYRRP